MELFLIGLGGAIGAILRFLTSNAVHGIWGKNFPYGTLSVNVIGSLIIGICFVIFMERNLFTHELKVFLMVGILGAFTTFSTFSLDTLLLIEQGQFAKAGLNMLANVLACIVATSIGFFTARSLIS